MFFCIIPLNPNHCKAGENRRLGRLQALLEASQGWGRWGFEKFGVAFKEVYRGMWGYNIGVA